MPASLQDWRLYWPLLWANMEDLMIYILTIFFSLKIIYLCLMLCSFYGSSASGDLDTPATKDEIYYYEK